MSSFRNQRVIIASLFLPATAVLGDSPPPTPPDQVISDSEQSAIPPVPISASLRQRPTITTSSTHTRQSSLAQPLKSIVDDLKDKTTRNPTPALMSPVNEVANPFTKLTRFADTVEGAITSLRNQPINGSDDLTTNASVKPKNTSPTANSRRKRSLQRKTSRSASRRSSGNGPSSTTYETFHIEPNPHCNGGLKNAIDSVGPRLRKKLWVGSLGTSTDDWGDALKKSVDERMRTQRDCLPVWIPDAEFQSCYDEFCHQVLWPCLHYAIPDAPKTKLFYESASYKQYVAVNQRFADAIIANYQEGDIIWVNDYHLLLLPLLLRSSPLLPPSAPIGFFMHVAFPSSEIFRCLSVRSELLRGLLGADLVGFQTANYARHFRQTVSRILAWEAVPKGVVVGEEGGGVGVGGRSLQDGLNKDLTGDSEGGEKKLDELSESEKSERREEGKEKLEKGRFVDVGVFPMGIDVKQLMERKNEPEVAEWVQVLKQRYAGMKILVGRDKLDEIQGVRYKILAFEAFLDKYPEFQGKVVMLQVALPTTESPTQAASVADIVSRINSRFSTLTYQPVVFLHTADLTFSQYLALLTVGDAFIVGSLREGMALRTHEFVECQEGRWRPLVLSEFTGSYSYSGFRSCIAINPWDTRGTAAAIYQALTMSDEEAKSRWEDLHNHVTTQTAQAFVTSFLTRVVRANTEHQALDSPEVVPVLDPARVIPRYKHSSRRLVLVDFEGSLWTRDLSKEGLLKMLGGVPTIPGHAGGNANANLPPVVITLPSHLDSLAALGGPKYAAGEYDVPSEIVRTLTALASDKRNEVWVLSGLPAAVMERVLGGVKGLGMVAENGCFIKTRVGERARVGSPRSPTAAFGFGNVSSGGTTGTTDTSQGREGEWINMVVNFNLTWKTSCLEILNYFTERTPGSIIEERQASIVWRFWTGSSDDDCADRQWARRQAAEAQNHIFDSLGERYGLRIVPGKNSFLVLPNNISRSTAVGAILHPGGPSRSPFSGHASWASPDAYLSNSSSSSMITTGGTSNFRELDFVLAVSSDEKLLRRLNDFEGAETVSTSGKGTDARWRVEPSEVVSVLRALAGVV